MRFYFNLAGAVHDADNEGMEFSTLSEARIEAARFAGELLHERPELVWAGDELRVEITNEHQIMMCTVIVLGVDAPAAKGMSS
jgi:phage terminase large subunit-like protein